MRSKQVPHLGRLSGRGGDQVPTILLGTATNEDQVTLRRGYGTLASNGDDRLTSRERLVSLVDDLSARIRLLQHNLVGNCGNIPGLQQIVSTEEAGCDARRQTLWLLTSRMISATTCSKHTESQAPLIEEGAAHMTIEVE
jgi:hypothetical protein